MNIQRFVTALFCVVLCGHAFGQTNDIDSALSDLAEKIASQVQDHGKKKVAVIDFTDLDGSSKGELGKYIAEQLNVDLVMGKRGFSVLDRANLKSILAEHKLTATGLVDPDNAKKLGQFAGVDVLILGTMVLKNQGINLTAKIVTTDTAEIIGAARGAFKTDDSVQAFISKPSTQGGGGGAGLDEDAAKVTKKIGDLSVGLQSLKIINGGRQYLLTMTLVNQSQKKSIWVAMSGGMVGTAHQTVTDPNGFDFGNADRDVTGVPSTLLQIPAHAFTEAAEIKPGDSILVTIRFFSNRRNPTAGICNVQLGFLLGDDFNNGYGLCTLHSVTSKLDAD